MTRARYGLMAAALLLAEGQTAGANPWLKEKGEIEAISSSTVSKEQTGLAASLQSTSSFHLEYGATENATVVLDAYIQRYSSGVANGTNFDNAWLGARVPLRRWDNSLLSAEIVAGVSGIHDVIDSKTRESLYGTSEARVMFGRGFEIWGRHAFAGVEAGWRWRPGPPADEAVFDATAGIAPWSSALVLLQSFSIVGTGDASGAYRRFELSKVQLSITQSLFRGFSLQVGGVAQIAGGHNIPGVIVAIWWHH